VKIHICDRTQNEKIIDYIVNSFDDIEVTYSFSYSSFMELFAKDRYDIYLYTMHSVTNYEDQMAIRDMASKGKVIAIIPLADFRLSKQAVLCGASDFVVHPFSEEKLKQKIKNTLDKK